MRLGGRNDDEYKKLRHPGLDPGSLKGIFYFYKMERGGYVYFLTNYTNSVLYIGVTSNLVSRVFEHKNHVYPDSFTAKYNCYKLVYFESFNNIEEAIAREKNLKNWKRDWKNKIINDLNPEWKDLSLDPEFNNYT